MSVINSELPKGWAAVRVDRVGAVRLGRQRSPDKHTGEHTTKYLRAANVKPTGLDLNDILEMDFTPTERVVFALRTGDILLTEASGTRCNDQCSACAMGRAARGVFNFFAWQVLVCWLPSRFAVSSSSKKLHALRP